MSWRRRVATTSTTTVVLTLAGIAGPAPASTAEQECARTPALLAKAPVQTYALPGGASARVWDTGKRPDRMSEARLAAVTVPRKSLTPTVLSSPTLTTGVKPSQMMARDPKAVVAVNGAVFDEYWDYPVDSQILGGVVRKGTVVPARALAVYGSEKSAAVTRVQLSGSVQTRLGTLPVGAVNWQNLSRSGVTAYTRAWGAYEHPAGPVTVVVSGGKVIDILDSWFGQDRPATGETYLTARAGSRYAATLAKLRVGDKVTVTTAAAGSIVRAGKNVPIGRPSGLLGFSSVLLAGGVNEAVCSERNEMVRPRSAVGWKKNGDVIVAVAAGRVTIDGIRFGGASVHQFGDYLRKLGAVDAVLFDGGNSTTLLVRKKAGGPMIRLDRSARETERAVSDAFGFRLG
jgi:hypothetical protein